MLGVNCIITAIFSIFCYRIAKDFFHPSVIVSVVWCILLNIYYWCDHPLYILSDIFFYALWLWILPFCLGAIVCSRKVIKISPKLKKDRVNLTLFNKLYPLIICLSVLFISLFFIYSGGFSLVGIRDLLLNEDLPWPLKIGFYANSFFSIYVFYALLYYKQMSKKKIFILIILVLLLSVLKGNKTSFIAFFCGLVYCLYKTQNFRIRYLVYIFFFLLLLLSAVSVGRADYNFEANSGISNFIYIYTISPLTAFDALLNNEVFLNTGTPGNFTFSFFYKILIMFGIPLEIGDLGTWISVPLPTNVFTTLRGFYLDFGFWGIFIIGGILGGIWGVLYKFQENNYGIFVLFYASMIYSLFVQFFGDYFFFTLSVTLQYFFFSHMMYSKMKKKSFYKEL